MKKPIRFYPLIIILLAWYSAPVKAQDLSGTIRGKVIYSKTEEPLQGVEIILNHSSAKTITDKQGHFVFPEIPAGTHVLEFSFSGYKNVIKENILVKPEKEIFLQIELEESLPRINEYVTVFGKSLYPGSRNAVNAVNYNAEELSKTPGTIEDISRVLNITPGVSQINEFSNELMVRGGSPWENGFYIDNIHVPNINHFQNQGSTGGFIGMIDVAFVENVDFYTSGFSVSYGDRMSSITEIRYREGIKDGIKSSLNLYTAGFGGHIEGGFLDGKSTWMFSLRRSYHDFLAKIIGYGTVPRFGDANFKLSYDVNKNNKITLLNIYGNSLFSVDLETALEDGINNSVNYKTNQNTIGINWIALWNEKGYSETSLSYSFFNSVSSFANVKSGVEWVSLDSFYQEINLRNMNVFQPNSKSRLEFGLNLKYEKNSLNNYFASYLNRLQNTVPEFTLLGEIQAKKSGIFLAYIYNPLNFLTLSTGVRADYFSYNRHIYISPRFTTTLHINERLTLAGSFGIYNQTLPLYLLYGSYENKENKDPAATQFSLSLNYDFTEYTQFSISVYNKNYNSLPLISDDPHVLVMDSVANFNIYRINEALHDSGAAYSRGLEILLKKSLARGFYGIVSISLFRSRFNNYDGVWTNRLNDNQYLLTAIGEYKTNGNWRYSIRCDLAGGIPYSPCDIGLSKEQNSWIIDQTQINDKRYPPFLSLKLRIDRRFKFKKSVLYVYLSVLNALNRRNILSYYWNSIDNKLGTAYHSPILPLFGIDYEF